MHPAISVRKCLYCDKTLNGRADKKFCNDYCRNAYNNQLKSANSPLVRNIHNALIKNRRIMETMLGEEKMVKQPKEKFLNQGFNFKYFTHHYTNQKGNVYVFCYEYGYLPLEHDWFLIVKRKEEH
ncbi:MAG TPA: hypothetical protein VNT20_21050 [Flavisolibacter sp.]|jgi:hypothetical protein|nr:hypothetical protein [Flavisolibacter sp.]